ncbi:protein kinase-like domain, concanavalin A-like lectin/glucanase domain protein [Tanacetum coccineum]
MHLCPNREFLDPKKKKEIESWLEDSRIVDSLKGSNEIEYFDTFSTMEELEYHEWLLKYPKPSWVKAKIRMENVNNVKISCKMGHFLKRQAYIDLESPINVMSKQHYNKIMIKGLESRQKPSNPSKNSNFVGRVKGLKVFVGNFTYECNFVILEDNTSIIDHHLGEVVFRKPFARNTGLVYDQEKVMVTFKKDEEKITFKMPHKMEASNCIDFKDINTDSIPPSVLGSNDDYGKSYYSDSLTLGPEYREDESISKEIRHLMKLEKKAKRHKGEVTKAHLLEDKQIPSVGVFDEVFSIWKAFGGNTRDLGSFGEETDKTTDLHQHLSRISTQKLETASQITRDAVTTHLKTASQDLQTASECTTQPII